MIIDLKATTPGCYSFQQQVDKQGFLEKTPIFIIFGPLIKTDYEDFIPIY